MKKKKPVILENLLVQDYAAEGKSIAKVEGKVVFIENTVPGDVVDVFLYKNKKDWAAGWPLRFRSYAQARVTPFCAHFGTCGGCQWQMLPYEQQLRYKQQQVADNMQRIGKLTDVEVMPIIGCTETVHYRNKLEYTFSTRKYLPDEAFNAIKAAGGDPNLEMMQQVAGFHAKGVFDKVVEIDTCHLQPEPSNAIRKAVAAFTLEHNMPFYDIRLHQGWLRNMMVRISTTGEIMVNIVFGYEDAAVRTTLLEYLLNAFPQISTLMYTINPKLNDSLYDLEPVTWYGKGYITEQLGHYLFKISPKSFFQTNTRQAEQLYRVTKEFAGLDGSQTVYDLYCGTGSIGIFVSDGARQVIGVEAVEDAITDAKANAALNNIHHASFYCGDVIKVCNDAFFEQHGRPDVVITDPPRAGMHEKLVQKLLQMEAPRIVYVSCNPATQARDLVLLGEKYTVDKIQPVDMFPHTHHIENVVQLSLKA